MESSRPPSKKVQDEAMRLSEAILTQNIEEIEESLKKLIKAKARLKLTYKNRGFKCDSHCSIKPNELNRFSKDFLFVSGICQYSHKFCKECILYYIKNNFADFQLDASKYECMYCACYKIQGTQAFSQDYLRWFAVELYGEQLISNLEIKVSRPVIGDQYNLCGQCTRNVNQLVHICLGGHQICVGCLKQNLIQLGDQPLSCFTPNCKQSLSIRAIIKALSADPILSQIRKKFEYFGFYLNFCPKCSVRVDLNFGPNGNQTETVCGCGTKICNNCGRAGHYGKTCFYFESNQDFEVIDLQPPKNIDKPENLKEQEYLNAKYAFENFLENPGSKFKGAKLIVNKTLEDRYAKKKQEMAQQCGGEDKVNEIYIWHGSKKNLYDTIMQQGLKVGGVDGIPISQGAVHGLGVYCATTPDTPMAYANDSNFILACLAMKGIESPNKVDVAAGLNTGSYHSYKPKGDATLRNWQVIFTKEQVLPRFLVEIIR